jgi:uncharacterized protein
MEVRSVTAREEMERQGKDAIKRLDAYRPTPSWFAHKPHGIHGIGHAARVLIWADAIGRQLQAADRFFDLEAVRWAAVLHDVGRLSDGIDRGHGSRSAEWVATHRQVLPVELSHNTLERVLSCCRWHEITDGEIPVMTPELVCIKDADGLMGWTGCASTT